MGFVAGAEDVGSAVDNCGGTASGVESTELIGAADGALDGATLAIAVGAIESGAVSGGI